MAAILAAFGAISACGGGGGGGGDPAAAPSAAPSPPEHTGTRLSLAQLPAGCGQSSCLPFVSAAVDAAGEASYFWSEAVPGVTPRLRAANHAAGSSTLLGSGDVASDYNTATVAPIFAARPIAARRFVVWQADTPAPGVPSFDVPLHARVVNFAGAGAPGVGPLTTVPSWLSGGSAGDYPFPGMVRDGAGSLYAFANALTTDIVVPLGDGASLTVVPMPMSPLAATEASVLVEYAASIAPRAMWALRGSPTAGAPRQMMLADVTLPDATVLPTTTVSSQTFAVFGNGASCGYPPEMRVRASVTSVIQQAVAWLQVNAAGTGCDLMVNGTKVSGARSATQYELSVSGSEIVAVWQECEIAACNVYWSRRPYSAVPSPTDAWSAPAVIASSYVLPSDTNSISAMTSGPNGTLLVAWNNLQYVSAGVYNGDAALRVSKYVNGAWTTVKIDALDSIRALSINGAGQGTAVVVRTWCGTASCEELAAYRF